MALIIEDGSIVAGANSFVTDTELQTYANLRNFDLPATQPDREALLVQGMDYLFSKEADFKGCRVSIDQPLMYPRRGATVNGFNVPITSIPMNLKAAQMELALAASTITLMPNESLQNVQSTKVDVLQISYFQGGSMTTVNLQAVEAKLRPLLKAVGTMTRV